MKEHRELEQLSAYLDGELDADARAQVESHLPSCPACRETLDALRATVTELRALDDAASSHDPVALRAAIARARATPARWGRIATALGGVAAVVLGFVAFGQLSSTSTLGSGSADTALDAGTVVGIQDTDYSEGLARGLLLGPSQTDAAPEAFGAPAAGSAVTADQLGTEERAVKTKDPLDSIDWQDALDRCHAAVTEDAVATYSLRESFGARYEGRVGLFLLYDVQPGDGEARVELWVMSPPDCDLLFWAQS